MKTIYDIQQFLKKFGTIIYVRDRVANLELMRDEVQELYRYEFNGNTRLSNGDVIVTTRNTS